MIPALSQHPEWKILFELFKDAEYGTVIPHEEIEGALGCARSEKYYGLVNRWKKEMLREASRQVESINKRGYEIIKPEAFRTSAKKQLLFGNKRIKKAGEIVLRTPIHLVSAEEKARLADMGTILVQILHFSKSTLQKVKEIDKKTDQIMLDVSKALDIAD